MKFLFFLTGSAEVIVVNFGIKATETGGANVRQAHIWI